MERRPRRPGRSKRARFKPDERALGASERERGEGEERLTGRARLSSLTLRQRVGGLTGIDAGHDEVGRGYGWTQRRVTVRVEVVVVTGVAWFTGDEVSRWRSFGCHRFRPFPAAKEAGEKGEMIRGAWGFQIERKQGPRRPVLRERRRAEAAELELDLELGWLWRQMGGAGGGLGVWGSDRE